MKTTTYICDLCGKPAATKDHSVRVHCDQPTTFICDPRTHALGQCTFMLKITLEALVRPPEMLAPPHDPPDLCLDCLRNLLYHTSQEGDFHV